MSIKQMNKILKSLNLIYFRHSSHLKSINHQIQKKLNSICLVPNNASHRFTRSKCSLIYIRQNKHHLINAPNKYNKLSSTCSHPKGKKNWNLNRQDKSNSVYFHRSSKQKTRLCNKYLFKFTHHRLLQNNLIRSASTLNLQQLIKNQWRRYNLILMLEQLKSNLSSQTHP